MADIKTNLREISVAISAALLIKEIPFNKNDLYDPKKLKYLANKVSIDLKNASNIFDLDTYNQDLKDIITNGYNLASKIFYSSYFHFNKNDQIKWVGFQTQKEDPIDLIIGNYSFSLKEDSFILKNMGLYQFLNDLTGSNYKRGLHVFSCFAKNEYNSWFKYTWDAFVEYLRVSNGWQKKQSCAYINGNNVILEYGELSSVLPINITSIDEYLHETSSLTREKVFSKWINFCLSGDEIYLKLKRVCSETAGIKIQNLVNNNFNPSNVANFFRIYKDEYYYAKTTANSIELLKVPSITDFHKNIIFEGCKYSIPSSQLNIISTFKNKQTNKRLTFRNECRFSHGQFNGTPEAKMYIDRKSSLSDLYISII